jgi:hypothetical protein
MKKQYAYTIGVIFLLLVAVVAATPQSYPAPEEMPGIDADKLVVGGEFGAKDSWWVRIKRAFSRQEFAFTSQKPNVFDTTQFTPLHYGAFFKTPTTTSALACDGCAVGSFCNIVQVDPVTYRVTKLFADYWYVSSTNDYINLASSQYFTAKMELWYAYTCYEPVKLPEFVYSCRDGQVFTGGQFVYRCPSDKLACKIADKTFTSKLSDSAIETTFCKQLTLCYQCSGSQVVSQYQDGCKTGWSTTIPNCQIPRVTCYQCQDGQVATRIFDNSCASGWSTTQPTCVPKDVRCYQCDNGQIASRTFSGQCATGWSTTPPTSCSTTCYACENGRVVSQQVTGVCPVGSATISPTSCDVPTKPCYQCQDGKNGVVISDLQQECAAGWSENQLTRENCLSVCAEGNIVCSTGQWFKKNMPASLLVVLAIMVIIGAVVVVINRYRRGNA